MTRYILSGLLALSSVGVLSIVPMACQSGGVGDPCTPEDEYNPNFAGFELDLSNIESRSFQCTTRICLVNHFQGRVSCPLGQDGSKLTACNPTASGCSGSTQNCAACPMDPATGQNKQCVLSEIYAPSCGLCDGTDPTCVPNDAGMGTCPATVDANNKPIFTCTSGSCLCDPSTTAATSAVTINGVGYLCQPYQTDTAMVNVLQSFQCHTPGSCQQTASATDSDMTTAMKNVDAKGNPKDCCIPGSDTPVNSTVCGQCGSSSKRNANQAVYCSCRCCAPCCPSGTSPADALTQNCSLDMSTCGPACDPNFNYCSCPSGYACTDIRAFVGLGDSELAGAYCIQAGTAYDSTVQCGVAMAFGTSAFDGASGGCK